MNSSFIRNAALAMSLALLCTSAGAQSVTPPGASSDVGNWGQLPFTGIANVALSQEALHKLRALEDAQLRARREMEDRFATEMRDLLAAQAAERVSLMNDLKGAQ